MTTASTMNTTSTPVKTRRGGSIPKAPSAGSIESGHVYPIDDFKRRTRWSDAALRTARRNGLTVTRAGNINFVAGDDFLAYLKKLASNTQESR